MQLGGKDLAVKTARVESKSPRVQAQILTFPNCKLVWINSYLPCDPQKQQFDDTELLETIASVESIISTSSECEVLWCGDLNYDERRDNHFTRTVAAALRRLGLTSVWRDHPVDHTHIHTDGVSTSTIDHIMVSPRLLGLVESGAGRWPPSRRPAGCRPGTARPPRRRRPTGTSCTGGSRLCPALRACCTAGILSAGSPATVRLATAPSWTSCWRWYTSLPLLRHSTLLGRRVRERAELFYAHDEDIAAPVSNSATSIQPTQTKPLLAI